ncbi:MAG TPA: hypothetical protein VE959_11315, partial [Bryobacteraceae bacterium]|nr:hypothetical protein [Bryobacteraceae bacterium]
MRRNENKILVWDPITGTNDLLVSPMVLLEMQYLYERKRMAVAPASVYATLHSSFDIGVCGFPFAAVALAATTAARSGSSRPQQLVHVAHHLERVGH